MPIDRREFLILSGAALIPATTLLAQGPAAPQPVAAAPAAPPWHQTIKRIGQLNFNERDPVDLDVTAWADYWASLKVDAILLSVTGIIAFYPTAIANFRKSQFLNNRDLFGECVTAAKKRNIRIIARLSPDLQWNDAATDHPEWFRRDRTGRLVEAAEVPGLANTCPFTSYYSQQIPAIMREINTRYDVDGLYTNGWPNPGPQPVCYCEACRNAPAPNTPEFFARADKNIADLWKLYSSIAIEKRPENVYYGNLGAGTRAHINMNSLAGSIQWFNCDNQGRGGEDTPAWACAQQGRAARSVMKGKTITNVTGAWATGAPKWRNSAKSPAEANLWMAQTVASGMTIWYHWLGAQTGLGEDHRWQATGRDFLQWMAKSDPHFTYRDSLANLGVVWSQNANRYYKSPGTPDTARDPAAAYADHTQGLYYALLEGRFLFDFVHEDDLSPDSLKKYSALLLPNVALLSDAQARQLTAFVNAGGSLLTTFQTGLFDQTGKPRPDFALADLFNMQRNGEIQNPLGNGYFARIERPHDLLAGFANTNILPGAEYRLPVKTSASNPVLTVIPAYTSYPPERVYSPTPHTTEPGVILLEKGASRLLHFPGDIERSSWRSGNSDLSQLLQNAIRWVTKNTAPITVTGEGLIELFAWQTDPGFALHILNYNNPNLHKGWIRKHYPLGPQTVTMQLPQGVKINTIQLLRAGAALPFTQNNQTVTFTIPRVDDYEVAALTRA